MTKSKDTIQQFANRIFSLIELIEVSNIDEKSFIIIRKKLLDLANDLMRCYKDVN